MKVYGVNDDDGIVYFATKGAALKNARQLVRDAKDEGLDLAVEVDEVSLVPMTKDVIVRLLNVEGGYVDARRLITRFSTKVMR